MATILIRLLRGIGWTALVLSAGIVVFITAWQSVQGPVVGQQFWPSPALWRSLGYTLSISAMTIIFSFVLGLPAAFALLHARRNWQRTIMRVFTLIPLLTMPSVYAYAWLIIGTSTNPVVRGIISLIGWNRPGVAPVQAAWVLANWLWPIPALIIGAAFRHGAATAYRLACLDAIPIRAFFRGALPTLRGPLVAAAILVFILATLDTLVSPLMGAAGAWATEVMAQSTAAVAQSRPAGFLFGYCWPVIAMIGILAALAIPGLRQMASWTDESETGDSGAAPASRTRTWILTFSITMSVTLFPLVVFAVALASGRYTIVESFQRAWHVVVDAGLPTLMVALISAVCAVAATVAIFTEPDWPRPARVVARWGIGLALVSAILPAPLISTCLVSFFSQRWISPPERWNLYDNTPFVWVAAMLARFAFIPICVGCLMNLRLPRDISAQASLDGADRYTRLVKVRLPLLLPTLAASGLITACLVLSEVAASLGVQPPQWSHGSLAVYVDSQMHYGRHDETVALSIIMLAVPVLVSVLLSFGGRTNARHRVVIPRSNTIVRMLFIPMLLATGLAGCSKNDSDGSSVEKVIGGPGLGDGEFSYPRGIIVSPVDGHVFVVDKSARIQRFTPDGQFETSWRMPEMNLGKPTGLDIDAQGRLWVPDTHYARVIVYDRDGHEQFRFGSRGEGPGQFIFPTAVLVDRENFIYVGEYGGNDRISKFSPQREYLFSFADKNSGDAWVDRPTEILLDEQDILWVADACKHRISRYDRQGKFLSSFFLEGIGADSPTFPFGMAFEKSGTLLIADRGNNRILRYSRDGKMLGSWGKQGRALGQLQQPWGVAVGLDGRIYGLDSWNNRVQMIHW